MTEKVAVPDRAPTDLKQIGLKNEFESVVSKHDVEQHEISKGGFLPVKLYIKLV
jgi:hypothetical protein